MPYIETKTNVVITEEKESVIREELGRAIELIRGKSERWLMLSFFDGVKMAFSGHDTPTAMIEVKIFGKASRDEYDALTSKITEIISTNLPISPDRIYVKYEEVDTWGFSGSNF